MRGSAPHTVIINIIVHSGGAVAPPEEIAYYPLQC
jgi:hypothetical protein